jgi:DNA-binding NarL/FixJ family response regulator
VAGAVTLLERGLALAEDIGMRPLADRIASRLMEIRTAGGRSYPDGLTRREVDVLQLVVRGMANRAELTAYAMRQGFAE